MAAALHCIVRDIEDSRLRDQLRIWRENANADPLIQTIRGLRAEVAELERRDRVWSDAVTGNRVFIENLLQLGWELAEAGNKLRFPTTVPTEDDFENWDSSHFAWFLDADESL